MRLILMVLGMLVVLWLMDEKTMAMMMIVGLLLKAEWEQ
jgi:hypothetical protein